ncbi:MAG: ABC transporter substrate-binding protein, partial [Paracoccaceae bacterium]|nr:ABC transporter substrate-binding protein [Paracoccaceae bacterium]
MTMKNSSIAQYLAVASRLPRLEQTSEKPLNVGFLAPLSGPAKSWGTPGLNGCQIWVDSVNATGG